MREEILSACPFAVSTLLWEGAPEKRNLTVSVKATFCLVPGGVATLAPLQEPAGPDRFWEDDPRAGLATASDLVPFKPLADVLLSGHAYAPGGAPIDSLVARLWVGQLRKSLSISGDRAWVPSFDGVRPSLPVPFRRMPLRYDRAVQVGENLGGVEVLVQRAEVGRPLPNIGAIAEQGGETPGFGPLPLLWRARRSGLSDAALLWATRVGMGAGPPPPGFDFRVFNAAPTEQQIEEIPPGVPLALENLHPEHARLETRLPALRVRVFRLAPGSLDAVEATARCDTLFLDADRGLVSLTWRAPIPLEGSDPGTLVVTAEVEGERVTVDDVERLVRGLRPEVQRVTLDLVPAPAAPEPEDHPTPVPLRPPLTVPPPAELEAQALLALPFRAPPTGFEARPSPVPLPPIAPPPRRTLPTVDLGPPLPGPDEDAEPTPPRGTPAPPPPPDLGLPLEVYCAVRLEAWEGRAPLDEILARRGIVAAVFAEAERRELDALASEAAAGGAAGALALLEELGRAEGRRGSAPPAGRVGESTRPGA